MPTTRSRPCPRCGEPIEHEAPAVTPPGTSREERVLCRDCYLEQFELVDAPERVEITVCSQCGAVHRGQRWVDVGARDYTDVAVDAVRERLGVHVAAEDVAWRVEPEQVDETTVRVHATFSGVVDGTPVEESRTVPVKIGYGTCPRCGRIAGGYYASTVQIRASGRTPDEAEMDRAAEIATDVVTEMEATGDRDAFVTETTEVSEGLDLKVSTSRIGEQVARRVTRELGGDYDASETLVTTDEDGEEVYRVTYAVRLPRFRPGDVLDPGDAGGAGRAGGSGGANESGGASDAGDGPVLVRDVRGRLTGVRLTTGEAFAAPVEDGDLPGARRLGSVADAEWTTLVAVEDDRAVQVLDPETYESKTVARPDYLDPEAGEVLVLKSRAGLHVLPDDARELRVEPGGDSATEDATHG